MMRSFPIPALALVLTLSLGGGCCLTHPSKVFPMPRPPDRSCDTGGPQGHDVWIWECVDGKRVVIYRLRGEWGCNKPRKEVAPCGGRTAFETGDPGAFPRCLPMPKRFRWPR